MHRKVAAAVFAALMLAVAGCGGGDGGEELTQAQLVSRVERICQQASQRMQSEARSAGGDEAVTVLLTAAAAAQEDISTRIDGFEPPDELSDDWTAFKESIAERADVIGRAADSARAGADDVMRDIESEVESIGRRLSASAQALGVRDCD